MKNKTLLIIVIVLCVVYLIVSRIFKTTFFMTDKENSNIVVKDPSDNTLSNMDLEDYVVGVVASEMPASFEMEALKAQAVASRTYAVYKMKTSNKDYDVVADISNQGYITKEEMQQKWGKDFNKYYEKVKEATLSTKGEVLTYNGEVIEAFYFAMSNGYTESSALVFSEDKDYLQSVVSIYDNESLKNFSVTKDFTKQEFCNKLSITCDNIIIKDIKKSQSNRVNEITINNKVFKGTEVRKLLDIRSTDFTITILNDKVMVNTKGYGHGVGMSQYGANGMAKDGSNYKDILTYYYKNVKLSYL